MKLKTKFRFCQKMAFVMAQIMILQIVLPATSLALTSGPTQPEVQSFEPVGTTQMVDLFTGDFNYNIPLLEVPGANGGYPINLFYNSVTNIEEESSMVGLGWNIGIGALTNNVRGVPDAFNGELMWHKTDMKDNWTVGGGFSVGTKDDLEIFGADLNKFNLYNGDVVVGSSTEGNTSFLNLSLGVKFLYNSYKGFGYSFDPGVAFNMGNRDVQKSGTSVTASFGFSLNSLEGVTSNAGVGISNVQRDYFGDVEGRRSGGLGLSMSGKEGLKSLSGYSTKYETKVEDGKTTDNNYSGQASYTFAQSTYTPSVEIPFGGTNLSINAKFGLTGWGIFGSGTASGFFTSQKLKKKNQWVAAPAYGYMHQQNADSGNAIMDFNREKDAPIYHNQNHLAIPIATPDILTVSGHGVGGSYRAYRSDWGGVFLDQAVKSSSVGGAVGADFGGGGLLKLGLSGEINWAKNESKRPNLSVGEFGFHEADIDENSDFEPYFYKAMSDVTAELDPAGTYNDMGGDEPAQLNRDGLGFGDTYTTKGGTQLTGGTGKRAEGNRKPRSTSIQPITNKQLLSSTTQTELIPEYRIQFFQAAANNQNFIDDYTSLTLETLDRTEAKDENIAGYTVLNNNGVKWNYALPVMNNNQYEASFSVDSPNGCVGNIAIEKNTNNNPSVSDINYKINNTDEYLDLVKTPAYAHAHLLTSVLGTDYIDADDIPGPSDGDKGYWMRVDYVKTSDDYIWKTPFNGANFIEGYNSKDTDDKATFMAGSREQFYPGKISTNTHVAEFVYSKRKDSRAAGNFLQNEGDALGDYSYKLESVKLFSKTELAQSSNPKPVKTVHFEYAYELSGQLINNGGGNDNFNPDITIPNSTKGKLTLKKVWFTYEDSNRGALSPYTFEYNDNNPSPDYSEYAFDRWGVYKPATNSCDNIYEPYVDQFDNSNINNPSNNLDEINNNAKSWHLTDIFLPSGSHIKINLERDQYAYVQDRTATQMFKISRTGGTSNPTILSNDKNPDENERRIYFKLEEALPVPGNNDYDDPELVKNLNRYIDDLYGTNRGKQLYYKINADLINHNTPALNEDVAGYADIDKIGVDDSCIHGGNITEAYIQLKPFPIEVRNKDYHPFVIGNWQFLKVNLSNQMFGYDPGSAPASETGKVQKFGELIGMLKELIGTFRNYYHFCRDNDFGTRIDLDRSFIRLNSPDKKKYGGGLRVSKITMEDSFWGNYEETPTYGVVYDYDVEEKEYDPDLQKLVPTGRMISSGVATNEPSIGREACALRYSKSFKEEIKFRTDLQVNFEYPLNESYYPGPSVGYSQVTVKSLASDYALERATTGSDPVDSELPPGLPTGFATSGVAINEFYTAKDFPIVTDETEIDSDRNAGLTRNLTIPFIGTIRNDKYIGTKGYSIELNNMHGKAKKMTYYAQDNVGNVVPDPVSSVEYKYQEASPEVYTLGSAGNKSKLRHRLDNMVTVLLSDRLGTGTTETERVEQAELGVEREFFVDARDTKSVANSIGVDANNEVMLLGIIPINLPIPWPDMNWSKTRVKTSATNKIIRRSGILKEVIAYDGKSKATTENIAFDQYTGAPILSTVNNNYDNTIYNYTIPAHFAYEKMGPAYENIGLKFKASIDEETLGYYPVTAPDVFDKLQEGDEFIISDINVEETVVLYLLPAQVSEEEVQTPLTRGTLIKKKNDGATLMFALDDNIDVSGLNDHHFHLVRSGKRNHLSASVGSISSLGDDPTQNRQIEGGCQIAFETPVSAGNIGTKTINVESVTTDSVINVGVMTYNEGWIRDQAPYCNDNTAAFTLPANYNPYQTGELGIWRPHRTFSYVINRDQSAEVDLDVDGTYTLELFDWSNPLMLECNDKWRMVEEVTKYGSNSQALESKNILGLHSTSLYGYNDYLPTAVAANAEHFEIGFEGFEEFNLGNNTVSISNYDGPRETGHIDFLNTCPGESIDWGEMYPIHGVISNIDVAEILIEKETTSNTPAVPTKAVLSLVNPLTGESCTIAVGVTGIESAGSGISRLSIDGNLLPEYLEYNNCYTGDVALHYTESTLSVQNYYDVYLSKSVAHTGNQSLMVAESNATFEQKTLNLKNGEKYVFSAWVNIQTPGPVPTYDDGYFSISFGGETFVPAGPVVEGWQRVEGQFVYDETNPLTMVVAGNGNGNPAFIDDLRVFPADGNIQTYVYDKVNYRVTDILDDNNYFTRYKYDSEGNLISVQKETLDGLKSLQESGSFVRTSN